MKSLTIEQLKQQKIITDPTDLIARTWLKGHPSLGKSDEVVWIYEIVREEFKSLVWKRENTASSK